MLESKVDAVLGQQGVAWCATCAAVWQAVDGGYGCTEAYVEYMAIIGRTGGPNGALWAASKGDQAWERRLPRASSTEGESCESGDCIGSFDTRK